MSVAGLQAGPAAVAAANIMKTPSDIKEPKLMQN